MPRSLLVITTTHNKRDQKGKYPLTVMNRDDNSGVGGQVLWNIDVHQSARGIVSKASHLLQRARGNPLVDILAQCPSRRQGEIEEQGNEKRER